MIAETRLAIGKSARRSAARSRGLRDWLTGARLVGGMRAMSRPHAPVRRTLTRLTILRTRSSRSSAVIICDASRLTPCATAPRRGCGSSRVPPAAPDGPAAPLSKGSGVKNRGDETSFTVGVIAGHAEKTLNLPESTANRERARACAERASPRASPRDARRPVERSEKRSAASTPEKTRAL